jgi:hypothetical protein
VAILSRLFGRPAPPEDPLVAKLADMIVPLSEAPSFVAGYEPNSRMSGLTRAGSGRDRASGAIAQYTVQWDLPRAARQAKFEADALTPFVDWVRQLVVVLRDRDATTRWFAAKAARFKGFEGRDIEGFRFGKVDISWIESLGDEAALLTAPNDSRLGFHLVDTYINLRRGRLFGCVSCSTHMDPDVQGDLRKLADLLLVRMKTALSTEA